MLKAIRPKNRVIVMYLLVPVLIYIFTVFVPLIAAFYFSFFQWKGGPKKTFIGLENYVALVKDSNFWSSFGHNIYLVVACIIGQIGLAFIFVLMINSRLVKLKGVHRTFGFFPSTISAVAIGFIWRIIYDYSYGLINYFIDKFGATEWVMNTFNNGQPLVWKDMTNHIMLIVSIPLIWQFIGYYMVIILSAISSVDQEIFEVAELDGANAFQRAVYIIFPLIKNTLVVCVTLCIAGNMKAFDHIYNLTRGGPGTSSMVMALYGYNTSFRDHNMGYGSAISIGIFCCSLVVIVLSQQGAKLLSKDKGGAQ